MDLRKAKRILIVGGTFDPPHMAHLMQPRLAAEQIQADALAYIPAGLPPQKENSGQTSAAHRLAMVRLMVAAVPDAAVLTLEIDRLTASGTDARPSYTVDTLAALRHQLGNEAQGGPILRLLMGSDQAAAFDTWHEPERVAELAQPVVMPRPPMTGDLLLSMIASRQSAAAAQAWQQRLVNMPLIDLSSTHIRLRVSQGLPITGMVMPAVEDYIHQHGLYRA